MQLGITSYRKYAARHRRAVSKTRGNKFREDPARGIDLHSLLEKHARVCASNCVQLSKLRFSREI
jgi:hypothetical protein